MSDPKTRQKNEDSMVSWSARFGGLDQVDWLMIVASVLLGTVAKQHHFLDLPDRLLEWVLPFLLIAAGYKARSTVAN
jgi:uncharacterized membrane protein YbjE (DUF340 family)